MSNHPSSAWPARVRRAWAERQAHAAGSIRRKELAAAFGISYAQASTDLQVLLTEHPGCLRYDLRAKCYHWRPGAVPALPVPAPIAAFILDPSAHD